MNAIAGGDHYFLKRENRRPDMLLCDSGGGQQGGHGNNDSSWVQDILAYTRGTYCIARPAEVKLTRHSELLTDRNGILSTSGGHGFSASSLDRKAVQRKMRGYFVVMSILGRRILFRPRRACLCTTPPALQVPFLATRRVSYLRSVDRRTACRNGSQRNCGESLRSTLKAPSRNRPTTKWNERPAILDTASFIGRCIDRFGSGAL
jgi:hypothetical protein